MFAASYATPVCAAALSSTCSSMLSDADKALFERAYDLLRLARMNSAYYERRLKAAIDFHLFFEITIAIGTAGSIAAWAIWKGGIGEPIWILISCLATLLAVIKPIVAPAKRIELCTRQHQGWLSLYYGIDKLTMMVRQDGGLTRDTRRRFDTLYDRSVQLHQEDEKCPSERLIKKCYEVAVQLHPPETLWMPSPCGRSSVSETTEARRDLSPESSSSVE
jgi:hypothetical protein